MKNGEKSRAKQFQGWPRTVLKGGCAYVSFMGRNPVWYVYARHYSKYLPKAVLFWGLWECCKDVKFQPQEFIDWGVILALSWLAVFLTVNLICFYEVEIHFLIDTIRIKKAHSLIWRKYNFHAPHGWKKFQHSKSSMIGGGAQGQCFVIYLSHLDQNLPLCTIYGEKAGLVESRLQHLSQYQKDPEKFGFNKEGKKVQDRYAGRPGY